VRRLFLSQTGRVLALLAYAATVYHSAVRPPSPRNFSIMLVEEMIGIACGFIWAIRVRRSQSPGTTLPASAVVVLYAPTALMAMALIGTLSDRPLLEHYSALLAFSVLVIPSLVVPEVLRSLHPDRR